MRPLLPALLRVYGLTVDALLDMPVRDRQALLSDLAGELLPGGD